MSILKIENLTKKYGSHEVLKGINLEIKEKGIYALVGPNGAGKSTLFNIIANLITATSGEVEVVGKSNKDTSMFYETSFLKDNRVLYDYLSGYDHLYFIKNAQKIPTERVDEVVNKLDIASYMNKRTGDYSLGMKQHLLIAMAMLNKPKLMILDEPLNGLDPTSVIKVRQLFRELEEAGTTILIASHTLSEIDMLTNKIMFLKDGRIVEETLDSTGKDRYELILTDSSIEKAKNLNIDGVYTEIKDGKLIATLTNKPITYLLDKLKESQIEFTDITKHKIGSEERYMEIFMKETEDVVS